MDRELHEVIDNLLEELMEKFNVSRRDASDAFRLALGDDRIQELITETAAAYCDSAKQLPS